MVIILGRLLLLQCIPHLRFDIVSFFLYGLALLFKSLNDAHAFVSLLLHNLCTFCFQIVIFILHLLNLLNQLGIITMQLLGLGLQAFDFSLSILLLSRDLNDFFHDFIIVCFLLCQKLVLATHLVLEPLLLKNMCLHHLLKLALIGLMVAFNEALHLQLHFLDFSFEKVIFLQFFFPLLINLRLEGFSLKDGGLKLRLESSSLLAQDLDLLL